MPQLTPDLLLGTPIRPLIDGHAVSRISDLIIYSVESSSIIPIVREYGPSTKMGATVAGQTSVKAPEKQAFEKYLPEDVDIVSVHSLHGPTVTTEGQPLVRLPLRYLSPFQIRSPLDPSPAARFAPRRSGSQLTPPPLS